MDTSREYIKMCEKAEEVQKEWQPQIGDFVMPNYLAIVREWNDALASLSPLKLSNGWYPKMEMIWLPSQDQLQKMIVNDYSYSGLFFALHVFADDSSYTETRKNVNLRSPEQITLALVMEKKYNKIWNGEKWILSD
jgi:hypothetical protein